MAALTQRNSTDSAVAAERNDVDAPLAIRTTVEGFRWVTRITRGSRVVYITPTAESETDARRMAQLFLDELRQR